MNQISIVSPSVTVAEVAGCVAAAHIALNDTDRSLGTAEGRVQALREEQQRRRIELGRQLIRARLLVKRGEWAGFLEKQGIAKQRASDWMRLAGFVDSKSPTFANVGLLPPAPTLAAAGIDQRPRKSEAPTASHLEIVKSVPSDVEPVESETERDPAIRRIATHSNDIAKSLMSINRELLGLAKRWPRRSRVELVEMLLSIVGQIDGMSDD